MTQKYWITTHWPPYEDEDYDFAIELQYDHVDAGRDFEPDDLILIYQLKTGRVEKGKGLKRTVGGCGIIALVKATDIFRKNPVEYCKIFSDGQQDTKMYWKWKATTEPVSTNGYVSREEVNEILDYRPKYTLRGFGQNRSGLKKLTKDEFCRILRKFSSELYREYCQKEG